MILDYISMQEKRSRITKVSTAQRKHRDRIVTILPHENTYGQFYYPNRSISINSSMIEKIIIGVRAMGAALTSRVYCPCSSSDARSFDGLERCGRRSERLDYAF